jgi:uncharacterized membrane protein
MKNTVAAGIWGGVFFIALTGLLVGPVFGVSESAFLPLAGVALGAAVLSIYFQKRASTRILKGFEETKENGKDNHQAGDH